MLDFSGQTALVCGASQGMGLAVAQLLAENKARVICVSRNADRLEQALATLAKTQDHKYFTCDLSDSGSIQTLIQDLERAGIEVDILVNNSAGPKASTALGLRAEDLEQAYRQHLLASNSLSQALIPNMLAKQHGRIINIVSVSGKIPSDNLASSNIIRAAVLSWCKTLSNELADKGITVNSVLPGYTKTERLAEVITARAKSNELEESVIEEKIISKIPMQRFAKPEEIAAAVCFLASNQASYITGVALPVDGGYIPNYC